MPVALTLPLLVSAGFGGTATAAAAAPTAAVGAGSKALLGLSAASTATTAYGQFQQGKQAQATAKTQAAWNLYNSKVAKRQAEVERQATAADVRQQRKGAKTLLARQRAIIGASGLVMEGSPLLFAEDTAAELAKETVNVQLRGNRRAVALQSQSILDISKAGAAKTRAAGFGRAAAIGAGSSILRGAATTTFRRAQLRGTI